MVTSSRGETLTANTIRKNEADGRIFLIFAENKPSNRTMMGAALPLVPIIHAPIMLISSGIALYLKSKHSSGGAMRLLLPTTILLSVALPFWFHTPGFLLSLLPNKSDNTLINFNLPTSRFLQGGVESGATAEVTICIGGDTRERSIVDSTTKVHPVENVVDAEGLPPCTVLVENKPDYHYEVIESVILRYPLPWNELNCSASLPVEFSIAVTEEGHMFNGVEGWLSYYESYLRGSVRDRSDGKKAHIGNLVDLTARNDPNFYNNFDAVIGVSCGSKYQ
jgi:hypothetical protein